MQKHFEPRAGAAGGRQREARTVFPRVGRGIIFLDAVRVHPELVVAPIYICQSVPRGASCTIIYPFLGTGTIWIFFRANPLPVWQKMGK